MLAIEFLFACYSELPEIGRMYRRKYTIQPQLGYSGS